ncbi:L,D-transpeptidase [Actinopolymorpha sp. B11F2]|uniref:L,D-transpeptidase n=1 Tax=Actinopolymorpha sp. B11F2 TaxID=3160862 RepID=UPI0032E4C696
MRHAARRSRRLGHRRILSAGLSVLTLTVALLGATGLIPVGTTIVQPAADTVQDSQRDLADRAGGPLRKAPDPTPHSGTSPTAKAWTASPAPTTSRPDALPVGSGTGTRVVYALKANRVWLVKGDDTVLRSYLVSGTKYGQVEPGRYQVIRKRRNTTSYHGTERMEYMVTFTFGENAAIGFHDIPISIATGEPVQTLRQLGQSLSDGCVRQARPDAKALWDFAPTGTPVVVLA